MKRGAVLLHILLHSGAKRSTLAGAQFRLWIGTSCFVERAAGGNWMRLRA